MATNQSVPTNLITGFLGAGKSTAILNLLAHRPTGERWAVLVNEFGNVPIDQAIFHGSGDAEVAVKEVAGGCICCTAGVPMQMATVQLLRQVKPDRLLIELSGAGHPGAVLDSLRDNLPNLNLRATLCLVDPQQFATDKIAKSQIFHDQIHMSDVAIINKADQASTKQNEDLLRWLQELYPPKSRI